eukprot:m.75139 g.75139  ORF g.75139 m.75139 type:complete len:402 (-) comp20490_c1_seq3:91-1296(-)
MALPLQHNDILGVKRERTEGSSSHSGKRRASSISNDSGTDLNDSGFIEEVAVSSQINGGDLAEPLWADRQANVPRPNFTNPENPDEGENDHESDSDSSSDEIGEAVPVHSAEKHLVSRTLSRHADGGGTQGRKNRSHMISLSSQVFDETGCEAYRDDIFNSLKLSESSFLAPGPLLGEVLPRMRSILVDWLIEVQENFRLVPETLYLAVSILNRFLCVEPIRREKLQLVGATALFVASKHEELYPPELNDFVYICADSYTRAEILQMEKRILVCLDFKLCAPLAIHFLAHYAHAAEIRGRCLTMAKYFLELTLQENVLRVYPGSQRAAAALDLASRIEHKASCWDNAMCFKFGLTPPEIAACARLLNELAAANPRELTTCRTKYSTQNNHEVSCIHLGRYY